MIKEPCSWEDEVSIEYLNMSTFKDATIRSCYGDLFIICNALDDYASQIDKFRIENDLEGLAEANYLYHADRCKKISNKIADQIGYDKIKTLEKCRKKYQKEDTSDIGEDALVLAIKKDRTKPPTGKDNISQ